MFVFEKRIYEKNKQIKRNQLWINNVFFKIQVLVTCYLLNKFLRKKKK